MGYYIVRVYTAIPDSQDTINTEIKLSKTLFNDPYFDHVQYIIGILIKQLSRRNRHDTSFCIGGERVNK